jgi:hypothetical protein
MRLGVFWGIAGALLVAGSALAQTGAAKPEAAQPGTVDQEREANLLNGFYESQGAHFRVLFEGPADVTIATRALDILDAAYGRVGSELGTFPDGVLTVVLYTKEQFRDITRSPEWAAGSYSNDGRIRVPVRGALDNPRELERVLNHEFTHALVHAIAPKGVPTWLNEGLAIAFEPEGAAWAQTELAKTTSRLTLPRLASGFGQLSTAEARLAYAQSAVLVRSLLDLGGAPTLVSLLQDLARGESFPASFEARFLMPYDTFTSNLEASR